MADLRDRVRIVRGDITEEAVDAIVNAANRSLLGGGGVDGAIHRAAGPGLREECRRLGGCATGQAKLTRGHRIPAPWVIHTVGPIWQGGERGEGDALRSCYESCLRLASEHGIRTIAFPSISTGAYRFPKEPACRIALTTVRAELAANDAIVQVRFVCFREEDRRLYETIRDELEGAGG